MTTVTIPLTKDLNHFVNEQVRLGKAANKAEYVRQALLKLKEEAFISSVLEAQKEIREGKALVGDLDELAKGF